MDKLKLAISTCPNDTFIFGALIRKDIDVPFEIDLTMEDIQLCNNMALKEEQDIVKVSFGVCSVHRLPEWGMERGVHGRGFGSERSRSTTG